jgi:coatomer protein complex subunit alpha (xenin)
MNKTTDLNWPTINVGENYFEKALANGALEGGEPSVNGIDGTAAGSSALDDWAKGRRGYKKRSLLMVKVGTSTPMPKR